MARVSARVVPSATARSCVTTSRVSLSPLSDVSLVVVVSSVFLPVSLQSSGASAAYFFQTRIMGLVSDVLLFSDLRGDPRCPEVLP